MMRVTPLVGDDLRAALPALAELRIAVFRDWPYLYEGTFDSEQDYLKSFSATPDAIIVAACDGDDIVGVATGAPLAGHTEEFVPLFAAHGVDPGTVFYCGESVLLPAYRGQGIGHAFFDHREQHARQLGARRGQPYSRAAFCAVIRSDDDPRRPPDYMPLDGFWRKRGYAPVPGLVGEYAWQEPGTPGQTTKKMQFWVRPLPPAPDREHQGR